MRWLHSVTIALLLSAPLLRAQFTAFNDHYNGPNTHPNATAWNVYGPNSGALKDITNGTDLGVTITITNLSTGGGTTAGAPNPGTPAYNVFNGFIDWGNGSVNHAIQTTAAQAVGRVFSGLDPNKRYRYTGTAVRGGGYADRWIKATLLDAQSFTSAHTSGCLTQGTPGVTLAANEAALNSGDNLVGNLIIWENIQPSASGTFAVHCTQYTGPVPGGSSGGPYGYSIVAEKLEEIIFAETPAGISSSPQSLAVTELFPAVFNVGVTGIPSPSVQWYRNNEAIPGATFRSYTNLSAQLSDDGATYFAVAANVASNVSYTATSTVATLTVIADTTAPALVSVASAGRTAVAVAMSEPLRLDTVTNLANYFITNSAGVPLSVLEVTVAPDQTNLTLLTATQALGGVYTLVLNGLQDRSAASNAIAANTTGTFITADFTPSNIGNPDLPGSIVNAGGGYDVSGAGTDFGGTGDQFTFAHQQRAGDFDLKVRVASVIARDAWTKAAFMARESLESNSVFAATVATPLLVGCTFQSRATTGAAAVSAGTFPAGYPNTWLRLRRAGNVFTGFASMDGQTWVQLGSATLNVGAVYIGFAVTSHDASQTTTAQFRDYQPTELNPAVVTQSSLEFTTEQLNSAARTGPIVISEIMYKPGNLSTGTLEFVELYNSNPYFEDISGYRLDGDIAFTFPPGTVMQAGTFLVIARNPGAVQAHYGISGVLGPYTGTLPARGTVRLRSDSEYNGIMLTVDYEDRAPWPVGADGTGHSLVLTRASYGQNDPFSWDASDLRGGSPGGHEPLRLKSGLRAVMINEFLAHTDPPQLDYIELYNYSTQAVNISGCFLSDSATTNKFQIPNGTILPARGFIAFNETQLGFALNNAGESIFFRSADNKRMLDAIKFEPQENGVAYGRFPDGSREWYRLSALSIGSSNSIPLVNDIVINEIMYAPISEENDDEYIELYNKGSAAVDISGWQFNSGIDFRFPANTIIPADGYVVVAKNKAHLLGNYANLNSGNTFGNYSGQLSRDGERVALAKPDYDVFTNGTQLLTNTTYVVVTELTYAGGGRWGKWANQGGSSLELIDARSNPRLAYNWADSDETQKAPWTPFEHIGLIDTGNTQGGTPINRLEVIMMGEGECLLDDVEASVVGSGGNLVNNSGFESGLTGWTPQGNHFYSFLETSFPGYTGARSLHVRSGGNGDTGANRIRTPLTAALSVGQAVKLKGHVRWLRGWPEILLRVKGNYLESYGRMTLPKNLGTPGERNSRAATNAAPAIHGVVHKPGLPQSGEAVVVTAGVQDPDGLSNVTLFWRVDSASPGAFNIAAMNDDGVSGDAVARDGIYSATIPAQSVGTMVSFYVEATDPFSATSQFPVNAIVAALDGQRRECLVRWGDPIPVAAFPNYRLWMSQANVSAYMNRPALSNLEVDGTFVVNNNRPIYNVTTRYSNSPYHQGQNGSPVTGSTHFVMALPPDDKYLGEEDFNKIHAPGNGGFDDPTLMREQIGYFIARKMGLPYLYRRYVAMYVNGNRKGGANALQEDTQRPGGELIDEFFPDETEGRLYKLQPWFEFDDVTVTGGGGAGFDNEMWCTLTRNLSTNAHKISRYRQNWLTRSADKTANDYTNVIALIEAANVPSSNPIYWQNLSALIDVDQWTRIFAQEHAVGNWDSFGNVNAQNMYGWKPTQGKWKLMIWDHNIILNNPNQGGSQSDLPSAGNIFNYQSGQDPVMGVLNTYPPFRRAWWRAYKEIVNHAMKREVVFPAIDGRFNAFAASGVNINPGPVNAIKTFIDTARQNISNAMAGVDFNGFAVSTPTVNASSSNLVTITGSATFDITTIEINGVARPVIWTGITTWSVTLPVTNSGPINVVAYDKQHNRVGNTNTVNVNYLLAPAPDARGFVVFNEIMYNPAANAPDSEYVELFNTHSNVAFNLSGWRINGIDYTFPGGSYIGPRQFLLLVKNRVSFSAVYGASIAVFDQYNGSLQGDGETLTLIQPGAVPSADVVIDKLRYEGSAPWSTNAYDSGSSLQLIDANQDNSRAGNWAASFIPAVYSPEISTPAGVRDGWRFFSATGSISIGEQQGTNSSNTFRLLLFLGEPGSAIIDDLSLVSGTEPAVGHNYIRNGDFESPLDTTETNSWKIGTNGYGNTFINSDLVHSGNGAFKIVGTNAAGSANPPLYNRTIMQVISPVSAQGSPLANSTNTLSFWYWATNSATNLYVRIRNSAALSTGPSSGPTNINIFITPSNYVPPQLVSQPTNSVSPGASNVLSTVLPPFAPLWINEVQAENNSGLLDNQGEREPWIEIYNTSTNTVSLDGLFLSHNFTNYTNWAFPPGSSIGPTQFLVVICDGEASETTAGEYHTNFRLAPGSGQVVLSRLFTNAPQVMDFVKYSALPANRSYGSYPDGQPFDRLQFFYVTPGGTNDGRSAPVVVYINEWMASNLSAHGDPADGNFEDWFELYNDSPEPVNLAGYYLTDELANKTKYLITTNGAHIIPPYGFLLVWADNEPNQNTVGGVPRPDLHVNFALSKSGDSLGLFAPDGTTVDSITFFGQIDDMSTGRYPDGTGPLYFLEETTPGAPNFYDLGSNAAPVLDFIGNQVVYLGQSVAFTATATDSDVPAQTLTFSLLPTPPLGASITPGGTFTWTPAAVGVNTISVRVTDNGTPPLTDTETLNIEVLAPPGFANSMRNGNNLELRWGTRAGKSYALEFKEDLNAASWTPLWTNTAVGDWMSYTNGLTNGPQQFFRIRTVD